MKTKRIYSNAPWEKEISYCRAIQMGNVVAVSGTTSMKDGKVHAANDGYKQTLRCFEIIEDALKKLNLNRAHIIRTRMFVTDISQWKVFGKAHGEFFSENPPAATMVEVKSLIDKELLIEVEVDAVAP